MDLNGTKTPLPLPSMQNIGKNTISPSASQKHDQDDKLSVNKEQNDPLPITLKIILPTRSYFSSGLRELSRTLAKNMSGFSEQWAYRFQSVVDELINNAIEFGSKPGETIEITFMSVMNRYIEVFVKDNGTGKRGRKAKEIKRFVKEHKKEDPTHLTGIRGRGLAQIVSKWADSMDFEDNAQGGITAHVIKHFQHDEEIIIPV